MTTAGSLEPPGPRGLPLVGVAPWLVRDPFQFCMDAAAAGPGLTCLRVGPMRIYLVSHPDYVRQVLVTNASNYHKGSIMDGIRVAMGNGLFTADGEHWRRQRRTMQPAFHAKELARIGPDIGELLDGALNRWQHTTNDGIDLLEENTRLNIEIILRVLLGVEMEPERAARLRFLTDAVFAGMARRVWSFFVPNWVPAPGRRGYLRSVAALDSEIFAIIAERRKGEPRDDLLGRLLVAADPVTGRTMSDQQLRDEIFTIFLAGYESTATGLSWAWYLLDNAPAVVERLHAELDKVLAGRVPTLADLNQLPYSRNILSETFRLYPAFPMYFRSSIDADDIGEYRLPAKAQLVLSPYATHRDPRYWEDPAKFDPDRFTTERFSQEVRRAYYPFGMGQRRCIGEPMSLGIAQLTLISVAQRFTIRLVNRAAVTGKYAMTYQPRGGLPATISER